MLLPIWQEELDWSGSQAARGASIVLIMMALLSPVAGNLMDRYNARLVIVIGLTALASGIGATSFVTDPVYYYLLFGVVGGVGWAFVSIPMITAAVSGYFERMRGLAIGIAVSGASGGQLPILSGLGILIVAIGWRASYQFLALVVAALAILVLFWFKPPRGESRSSQPSGVDDLDTLSERIKFLMVNRTFLLLLGAFTLCGFTTAGVIDVYFIPYAISCGFTLVEGSTAYGFHGLGNLAGVVLFSWMADHVHRPRLLASMFFARNNFRTVIIHRSRYWLNVYVRCNIRHAKLCNLSCDSKHCGHTPWCPYFRSDIGPTFWGAFARCGCRCFDWRLDV